MIQEVKYRGYTAAPSDYDCPDGDLAAALNLIPDGSALVPLPPPVEASDTTLTAQLSAKYIHRTALYTHFIFVSPTNDLSYSTAIYDEDGKLTLNPTVNIPADGSLGKILEISSLGNILVVATESGLHYFLWKDNDYGYLGDRIPRVDLSFGLKGNVVHNWRSAQFSDGFKDASDNNFSYEHAKVINECAWAAVNTVVADNAKIGRFCYPFMVRYALRLYDGTLINHSAPVLMTPATYGPFVAPVGFDSTTGDAYNNRVQLQAIAIAAELEYDVLSSSDYTSQTAQRETLERWKDIVKSVDIFASAPIYTIRDDGSNPQTLNANNNFPQGNSVCRLNVSGTVSGEEESDSEWRQITDNHIMGEIGGDTIPLIRDNYAEWSYSDIFALFGTSRRTSPRSVNLPRRSNDEIRNEIEHCSRFYYLASIDIDTVIQRLTGNHSYNTVPIDVSNRNLANLSTRELMTDDFKSLDKISATDISSYNNRLNLTGVSRVPFAGYPPKALFAMCNRQKRLIIDQETRVATVTMDSAVAAAVATIYVEEDGVTYSGLSSDVARGKMLRYIALKDPLSTSWANFVFFPNANAKKLIIENTDNDISKYMYDLKPHDFLNGAYCFLGLNASRVKNFAAADVPEQSPDFQGSFNSPEKIFISALNNPFVFEATGRQSLGADVGTVFATCTAAKALSQGQFGQFPLYAFTDGGVWALEVGADGAYTARQPITRDVCICPEAITQIDSAVLFPTNRGIMLISGSDCQCISDAINTEYPFAALSMPHIPELHKRLGSVHIADNCLDILPFTEFLKNCRMIYDYVHQRIFVYNALKEVSYAYVYSLRSRQWGMTYCDIASNLNSYPNALAINRSGRLVDFSLDNRDADTVPALMITRPLKLGDGDLLKTMDTVIQRGNFARGHVQSVLYGSRDLRSWHTVWSSTDHAMRGFRGSPYKYFRIALLCKLHPSESITGASVQFTPRQANKLH